MTRARSHGVLILLTAALGVVALAAPVTGQANRPISTDADAPAASAERASPTSPTQPDLSTTASTPSGFPPSTRRPTLPMPVERQAPARPARPEVATWASADDMPDDRDPARLTGANADPHAGAGDVRGGPLLEALSTLPTPVAAELTPTTSPTSPTTVTSTGAPEASASASTSASPSEADVAPAVDVDDDARFPAPAPASAQAAALDDGDSPDQANHLGSPAVNDDATPLFQRGVAPDDPRGAGDGQPRGWADSWILTTLSSLGVVIGLILAARWIMLRVSMGAGGRSVVSASSSSSLVEVLARVSVSPRQQILLVRVVGRVLVVAEGAGGMTTLTELDDADEVAAVLQAVAVKRSASVSEGFGQFLARFAGGYDGAADPNAVKDPGPAARRAEGADSSEFVQDRTRHEVSGLLSKVRRAGREFVG